MKTVCSWCKGLMNGDEVDPVATHSICPPCFNAQLGRPPKATMPKAPLLMPCSLEESVTRDAERCHAAIAANPDLLRFPA